MKRRLLEFIVCPIDGEHLRLQTQSSDGEEVIDGTLTCDNKHDFPVTRGVPRLVDSATLEAQTKATQQSFSSKWKRIPNFGHEEASRRAYVNWYLERYGFGDLNGLRSFLSDKSYILDAGTGLGRDTLLYSENTRGEVFGIDLSESVNFAYEHIGRRPNVHIIQADLTKLPFRTEFFDFIASDQVLHHTPDTEKSFKNLIRYLTATGQIAAYVYSKKAPIREFSDDFLRDYYTTTSEDECYEFSRAIALLGKALTELHIDFDVPEDIPKLGIKAGRHNLQRFIYWHMLKCYWNDELDVETNIMTNFDWYNPLYAHRHTPDEVRQWCHDAGLEIIRINVVESGISVRARKGSAA